jgi:hypothetical protein
MDEINFILKVHCGFSIEEMNNLLWEDVENYYKRWYDHSMNEQLTRLALGGVQYSDPSKCKTSYYRDYVEEASKTDKEMSLREELKKKFRVREVVKRPKFLFEKEAETKAG